MIDQQLILTLQFGSVDILQNFLYLHPIYITSDFLLISSTKSYMLKMFFLHFAVSRCESRYKLFTFGKELFPANLKHF